MTQDEAEPSAPESVPDEGLETIEHLEDAAAPQAPARERLAYLGFYVGQEV